MTTAIAETPKANDEPQPRKQLPAIAAPRLPYHPMIEERFGIDLASWRALVEAVFPNASSINSVVMALSYCRARKLDVFKRVVHIVPIWNKDLGRMIDTIWPGIGELRTTAFRTREYAGRGRTVFGPDITQKIGSVEMTFPEWAQVSVFRMIAGQRVEFAGPQVYWLETYATVKRNDDTPNDMWQNRPRGQIDKCAEAAALRAAFPEEIGSDYIPEEVEHRTQSNSQIIDAKASTSLDDLALEMSDPSVPQAPSEEAENTGPVAPDGEILSFDEKRFQAEIDGCDTADAIRAAAGAAIELYPDDAKVLSAISGIEKTALDSLRSKKKPQQKGLPVTA